MDGKEGFEGFVLPPFVGVEEAIEEVREHGRRTGCEKLIALERDGRRRYVIEGQEHSVGLPREARGTMKGVLIVHGHPNMPVELSLLDMKCIWGTSAWGNLAASCQDETVSWTRGFDRLYTDTMLGRWVGQEKLERLSFDALARAGLEVRDDWSDLTPEQHVRWAHVLNESLWREGLIVDYHVRVGELAKGMLEGLI